MTTSRPVLDAAATLDLWDRAGGALPGPDPLDRIGALAAYDGTDPATLDDEPVGRCHARLLRLRRGLAGELMEATATCGTCTEPIEFGLDVGGLLASAEGPGGPGEVAWDGGVVRWRTPSLGDLRSLRAQVGRGADAQDALRARCLTATDAAGGPVDPADVPPEVLDRVEAAMADADPLAEVLVALDCPRCGAAVACDVDVAAFVWAELDARARRVVQEVGLLAAAFGWTEPEVLALSESRRAAYLRLVLDGAT